MTINFRKFLTGNACIPACILVLLNFAVNAQNVAASFQIPPAVCTNSPVQVVNTSSNVSNYLWSFCETNFQGTPVATNLGNQGNVLRKPVFTDLVKDQNGNYFAFINNHEPNAIIRYAYGNSYLNTPAVTILSDSGGTLVAHPEGIKIVRSGVNWIGVIVGGDPATGDVSMVSIVNFGTDITNPTPSIISYPNVGGINFPHDLCVFNAGNHWYGYTTNVGNSTLTKLDFGTDFSTAPTGTNLGTVGAVVNPVGLKEINQNGNWYLFVINGDNTITRLDFGSSLNNAFSAVNIGNPGNGLSIPRDISFLSLCDGITALVINAGNNTISKLNFTGGITSTPTVTQLGNIGTFNFPHSFSPFFSVNNDIYCLIPNVTTNAITRLNLSGCQTIPASTLETPAPFSYSQIGSYNISLIADLGLPTQTSFCQTLTVSCALPVNVINFVAQKNNAHVVLKWTTAQELNSRNFVIERSVNNTTWTAIATVAAAGYSNTAKNYVYVDNNPAKGINYYRLKQVDVDYRSVTSAVRPVLFSEQYAITVAPNPTTDFINVYIAKNDQKTTQVIVADINGKVIEKRNTGDQLLQISTSRFAKGVYFVKVITDEQTTTQKVIVQ